MLCGGAKGKRKREHSTAEAGAEAEATGSEVLPGGAATGGSWDTLKKTIPTAVKCLAFAPGKRESEVEARFLLCTRC